MTNWDQTRLPDGTIRLMCRRFLFRQEFLVRENYLECCVVFGRWRRVTRITEGWVYLEKRGLPTQRGRYQVQVRGNGGAILLADQLSGTWEENRVPASLSQLAELVAKTTEWRLDVPYHLRSGGGVGWS